MPHDDRCRPTDLALGYHCALCGAWEPQSELDDALAALARAAPSVGGVLDLSVDDAAPAAVAAALRAFQRDAGPVVRVLLAAAYEHLRTVPSGG